MKKIMLVCLVLVISLLLYSCSSFTDYNLKIEDTKWLSDVSI